MIKPIFTEKTLIEAQKGRYTFQVERSMNKYQIKSALEKLFGVHIVNVSTINYKGLTRRTIRGTRVTTSAWKKAVVSLKSGESIELFSEAKKTEKPKKEKKEKVTKK